MVTTMHAGYPHRGRGGLLPKATARVPHPTDALALPALPPELDGLRIALVADLHLGTFTNGPTVKRIVEETSRLNADLVLLPGDLINYALADLSDALDAVCNMQSRHGAYLCVGNHDLIEDGTEFIRRARARVPLLVNESRIVPIRGQLSSCSACPGAAMTR